jgi:NADH dehydrogenase (ubiquinone) Fe-S protein 3
MRLAAARPLGAVARATSCSRAVVRTFASTALRAKEVAGESKDTPNMRVRQPPWDSAELNI